MRVSKLYLAEGDVLPRFYGIAYIDLVRMEAVCYPIPINYIVNILHKIYWFLESPSIPEVERKISQAYRRGLAEGWRRHQKRVEEEGDKWLKERGWRLER